MKTLMNNILSLKVRRVAMIFATVVILSATLQQPVLAQGVLRIAAVVNDRVISALDVVERMKFIMFSTGIPNTPENQRRISQQVLRSLVDEEMQLQETERLGIRVVAADIDKAMRTLEERNKMRPGELQTLLQRRGISVATLRRKMEAEISWGRTVGRRLRREARISDDAIDDELQRIEALLNQPQFRVSEILLNIDDPDQEQQVRQSAQRLADQSRNGSNFAALARSFSQSTTASVGGDLGWIQSGLLSSELDDALQSMKKGDIAGPIRSVAGFHVIYLRDKRQASTTNIGDTVLDLRQIVFNLARGASSAETSTQIAAAKQISATIAGCADLPAAIEAVGTPQSGSLGKIKLADLPAEIRNAVRDLKTGQVSEPVVTAAGPVILFVPCERIEPKSNIPGRDQIRDQLTNKRFELLSRQYLRDLRRTAYVDLRG